MLRAPYCVRACVTEAKFALGQVEEIVTDEQRAEERSVKHPPKVSEANKVCQCRVDIDNGSGSVP